MYREKYRRYSKARKLFRSIYWTRGQVSYGHQMHSSCVFRGPRETLFTCEEHTNIPYLTNLWAQNWEAAVAGWEALPYKSKKKTKEDLEQAEKRKQDARCRRKEKKEAAAKAKADQLQLEEETEETKPKKRKFGQVLDINTPVSFTPKTFHLTDPPWPLTSNLLVEDHQEAEVQQRTRSGTKRYVPPAKSTTPTT
jgi:hypothetical protein